MTLQTCCETWGAELGEKRGHLSSVPTVTAYVLMNRFLCFSSLISKIGSYWRVTKLFANLLKRPWPPSKKHFHLPKMLHTLSECFQLGTPGVQVIVQVPLGSDTRSSSDSIRRECTPLTSPLHSTKDHLPRVTLGKMR